MTLAALLLACSPDPTLHPDFRAPTREPGVQVQVAVPRSFRIGELMEVEVQVSAPQGARLDATIGGVGGRPDFDRWLVRPGATVSDPSPYWEDFGAFAMADRRAVKRGQTDRFLLPLAQELHFQEPGSYGVQLDTVRIDDRELVLPPFALEVLPRDPVADAKAFQEALAGLEAEKPADREPHFRRLQALGSSEVLDLALERIQQERSGPWWSVLLHTHPDRERVRSELERLVTQPDGVVTSALFEALVAVRYDAETPEAADPQPTPGQFPQLKAYHQEMAVRQERLHRIQSELAGEVLKAWPTKTAGRGAALEAVSRVGYRTDEAPWLEGWLAALREGLDLTSASFREEALTSRWSMLMDPSLADALARSAPEVSAAGDLALRRLQLLDPDRARGVALGRLQTDAVLASEQGEQVLRALEELPQDAVDGLMTSLAAHPDDGRLVRLVAVLAPASVAEQVGRAFGSLDLERTHTDVRAAYAAYFLNTGTGGELLDRLLADRLTVTPDLLPVVALSVRDPAPLVRLAMKDLLVDANPALQGHAAEVLAEHGERQLVPLLMAALEDAPGSRQIAIATALFTARAWVGDEALQRTVMRKLNEERAGHITDTASVATSDMTGLTGWVEDGEPAIEFNGRDYVGREAVLAKLRQLPPGAPVKFSVRGSAEQAAPVLHPLTREAGLVLWIPKGLETAE